MLCNNADVMEKGNQFVLDGDPTEGAMLRCCIESGLTSGAIT